MATERQRVSWYDSRVGRIFYWGLILATLTAVVLSSTGALGTELRIPPGVYLFGFLGATVYAFTTFARRFDRKGRYRLKVLSRTLAALPLVAGVYLLGFAFTGTDGGAGEFTGPRYVAGLAFLAGLYVSTTLQSLEVLANRFLGFDQPQTGGPAESDEEPGEAADLGEEVAGERPSDEETGSSGSADDEGGTADAGDGGDENETADDGADDDETADDGGDEEETTDEETAGDEDESAG
jgi:hypothetical protein